MKKQIKEYNFSAKVMELIYKNKLAFTLIELLFVITIIGVLATLGTALMQQHAQKSKVEKAALQMQQILQAAQAYYNDNNCWPGTAMQEKCTTKSPPSFHYYVPFAISSTDIGTSPWGGKYWYGPVTVAPEAPEAKFRVCTEKPGVTDAKLFSQAIASQIKGILPSGSTFTYNSGTLCQNYPIGSSCNSPGNACIAAAEVTKPGSSPSPPSPSSKYIVAEIGSHTFDAQKIVDGDIIGGIKTPGKVAYSLSNTCPTDHPNPNIVVTASDIEPAQRGLAGAVSLTKFSYSPTTNTIPYQIIVECYAAKVDYKGPTQSPYVWDNMPCTSGTLTETKYPNWGQVSISYVLYCNS